jgi:hypothetical protein
MVNDFYIRHPINNIDLVKISQTIHNSKRDKSTLRKPVKLQGQWNFDPSKGYQFKTELSYEKGKQVIEIDSPSFLGGNGNRLGLPNCATHRITSRRRYLKNKTSSRCSVIVLLMQMLECCPLLHCICCS